MTAGVRSVSVSLSRAGVKGLCPQNFFPRSHLDRTVCVSSGMEVRATDVGTGAIWEQSGFFIRRCSSMSREAVVRDQG